MKPSQEGGGVTIPRGIREKDRYEITEGRGLEQSIDTGSMIIGLSDLNDTMILW